MAHTQAINEATPAGTDSASGGAAQFRDLKRDIRQRMELQHYWNDALTGDQEDGKHINITIGGTGVTANVLVPGGPVNTNLLPPDTAFDREKLIQPNIMMTPVVWLSSDESADVTGQRFIAYNWDDNLPIKERLEKAGAPAAWPQLGGKAVRPV